MAKSSTRKPAIHRMLGNNVPMKERNVRIGRNVSFGQGVILYDSVTIESNAVIGPYVVIGEPLVESYKSSDYSNPRTVIGRNSVIRSGTIVYAGCRLGQGTTTGHYSVIRERTVCGKRCSFGTFSTSDGDVRIGDRCRFHYYTFVCKNSTIGKDVWMFPGSMLLEDKHPPCGTCAKGPTIKDRAVVGSAAVIMPGLTIGEDSVVAAATLVTKDLPSGMLMVGNPGRIVGKAANLRCIAGDVGRPYPWMKHYRRPG